MDNNEFKPCPFCKKVPTLIQYTPDVLESGTIEIGHELQCNTCGLKLVRYTRFKMVKDQPEFICNGYEKLLTLWNRREEHEQNSDDADW